MKTNIQKLKEVINEQQGIGNDNFCIDKYFSEGWISEKDIVEALNKFNMEKIK